MWVNESDGTTAIIGEVHYNNYESRVAHYSIVQRQNFVCMYSHSNLGLIFYLCLEILNRGNSSIISKMVFVTRQKIFSAMHN